MLCGGTTTTRSSDEAANPPQPGADLTNWSLSADLNSSKTIQSRYVSGTAPDQYLARVDTSGGTRWLLTDHLGSVRNVTDGSGNLVDTVSYDSYGNITSQSGSNSVVGRLLYDGYQYDPVTGLYQIGWRDYYP